MGLNAFFAFTMCLKGGLSWPQALGPRVLGRGHFPGAVRGRRATADRRRDPTRAQERHRLRHRALHRVHRAEERRLDRGRPGDVRRAGRLPATGGVAGVVGHRADGRSSSGATCAGPSSWPCWRWRWRGCWFPLCRLTCCYGPARHQPAAGEFSGCRSHSRRRFSNSISATSSPMPSQALPLLLTLLVVDLFDNLGTLLAVTRRAGLMDAGGNLPRLGRALLGGRGCGDVRRVAGHEHDNELYRERRGRGGGRPDGSDLGSGVPGCSCWQCSSPR